MDDQDKQTSMSTLQETENWVVWKTRDKTWTHTLKHQGFHQLLSFHKDEKENISGSKIKGWSDGDEGETSKLRNKKRQNVGKDSYIIDLEDSERVYWLGTESGLLGPFTSTGHERLEMSTVM